MSFALRCALCSKLQLSLHYCFVFPINAGSTISSLAPVANVWLPVPWPLFVLRCIHVQKQGSRNNHGALQDFTRHTPMDTHQWTRAPSEHTRSPPYPKSPRNDFGGRPTERLCGFTPVAPSSRTATNMNCNGTVVRVCQISSPTCPTRPAPSKGYPAQRVGCSHGRVTPADTLCY